MTADPEARDRAINAHYGRTALGPAILDALRASGKDVDQLTPDDLAPVDHFHTGGKAATLELARRARLAAGQSVLDVGGGLGGPARVLAHELGCRVTVVDLTEEYCRVGEDLTRRAGLGAQVAFRHGDALALPFPDGSFDVAWTQHSTMNIPDKAGLYRQLHRVLRAGGRYACHEVTAGPAGPPHFPVPWARDPSFSFLQPAAELRDLMADAGFTVTAWTDLSAVSLQWFRQRVAALQSAGGPPALGLRLLLGDDLVPMLANVARNLEEGRIAVIQGVAERGR